MARWTKVIEGRAGRRMAHGRRRRGGWPRMAGNEGRGRGGALWGGEGQRTQPYGRGWGRGMGVDAMQGDRRDRGQDALSHPNLSGKRERGGSRGMVLRASASTPSQPPPQASQSDAPQGNLVHLRPPTAPVSTPTFRWRTYPFPERSPSLKLFPQN